LPNYPHLLQTIIIADGTADANKKFDAVVELFDPDTLPTPFTDRESVWAVGANLETTATINARFAGRLSGFADGRPVYQTYAMSDTFDDVLASATQAGDVSYDPTNILPRQVLGRGNKEFRDKLVVGQISFAPSLQLTVGGTSTTSGSLLLSSSIGLPVVVFEDSSPDFIAEIVGQKSSNGSKQIYCLCAASLNSAPVTWVLNPNIGGAYQGKGWFNIIGGGSSMHYAINNVLGTYGSLNGLSWQGGIVTSPGII